MKNTVKILAVITVIMIFLTFIGCKKADNTSSIAIGGMSELVSGAGSTIYYNNTPSSEAEASSEDSYTNTASNNSVINSATGENPFGNSVNNNSDLHESNTTSVNNNSSANAQNKPATNTDSSNSQSNNTQSNTSNKPSQNNPSSENSNNTSKPANNIQQNSASNNSSKPSQSQQEIPNTNNQNNNYSSDSNYSTPQYSISVNSKPIQSQEETTTSKPTPEKEEAEEEIKYIDYEFTHLANTYSKLTKDKRLKVAFLGGSVTDGTGATNAREDGWPRKICNYLTEEYDAKVTENRQSIGGTGSYFGAFRYTNDIGTEKRDQPDLLFIEFAINDSYIGESYDQVVKNSESLIRKAYSLNPKMDIVYVLTFDKGTRNEDYEQLRAHKDVAEKYGLICINLREILGPSIDFGMYFADDVHPNTAGYDYYANEIYFELMKYMPKKKDGIANPIVKDKVLPSPMSDYYKNLNLVPSVEVDLSNSKDWEYRVAGFSYLGNKYLGVVSATKEGAELNISFTGDEFALIYNAGPKMGKVEISIDGGEPMSLNGFLSYNNPKIFKVPVSGNGKHTVTVVSKSDKEFHLGAYTYN